MTAPEDGIARAIDALAPRLAGRDEPLVAVSAVRNEQDIVERFVRHNLAVVDGLIVLDHASRDATPVILQALVDEGLPLAVWRTDLPGKHQADWMSAMARQAAARLGAHPVVPLDADEFLAGSAPARMREVLRATARDGARALEWLSYVPMPGDPDGEIDVIARITHRRAREVSRTVKLAAGGDLAADASFHWTHGMHHVQRGFGAVTVAPPLAEVSLAHMPVRSVDQLRAKVATSRLANAARTGDDRSSLNYGWLEALVPLVPDMGPEDLSRAALLYLCERDFGDDEVVRDPVAPLSGPLRHTPAGVPDALQRVMWVAMDLAEALASRPGVNDPHPGNLPILEQNLRLRGALAEVARYHGLDPLSEPEILARAVAAGQPDAGRIPARTLARELLRRTARRLVRVIRG